MKNKWCTGWRQGRGIGGQGSEGSTRARQPRKGASCPQQGAGTENTQGEGEPLCPWRHPSHCAQRSGLGRMVTPRHTARGRPHTSHPGIAFLGLQCSGADCRGRCGVRQSHTDSGSAWETALGSHRPAGPGVASCSALLSPCPGRAGPYTEGFQAGWRRG